MWINTSQDKHPNAKWSHPWKINCSDCIQYAYVSISFSVCQFNPILISNVSFMCSITMTGQRASPWIPSTEIGWIVPECPKPYKKRSLPRAIVLYSRSIKWYVQYFKQALKKMNIIKISLQHENFYTNVFMYIKDQ